MTSAFDLFADDDDFRGNFVNVNDFEEEDDDVMDNWEDVLDEEEEEEKRKREKEAEEERKRKEREEKLAKRAAEKAKQEQIQALMNAKPLSKEEQERAQLRASEAAANDLFGFEDDRPGESKVASLVTSTAVLSLNNPDSIDTYVPVDPEDFAELSRRIIKKLKNYQTDEGYTSFIRDLIPELCSEMNSDEIKKVSNPLMNLTHEKSRQEKEAKKKAQQASKKSSLNVQKKQNDTRSDFLMNEYKSMAGNYDDYDDFDDFM
ncbi:hypothetical protein ACHWQZ_G009952 [Mnemiopsis leidyi]